MSIVLQATVEGKGPEIQSQMEELQRFPVKPQPIGYYHIRARTLHSDSGRYGAGCA